jgi:hypothetical protein
MSYRAANAAFVILILITFSSQSNSGRISAQENPASSKKGFFTILPYYHSRNRPRIGCHPVEVKVVSIGARPPEVLTSQVVIESFSTKPVSAVRLRWEVYSRAAGRKKTLSSCDATPEPADTYLFGTTPLIQVGHFANGEIYNITSIRGMTFPLATNDIILDRPIIAWDEVKGLTLDGTRATFKGDYAAIIYVSEVRFEDGTKWEGTVN